MLLRFQTFPKFNLILSSCACIVKTFSSLRPIHSPSLLWYEYLNVQTLFSPFMEICVRLIHIIRNTVKLPKYYSSRDSPRICGYMFFISLYLPSLQRSIPFYCYREKLSPYTPARVSGVMQIPMPPHSDPRLVQSKDEITGWLM